MSCNCVVCQNVSPFQMTVWVVGGGAVAAGKVRIGIVALTRIDDEERVGVPLLRPGSFLMYIKKEGKQKAFLSIKGKPYPGACVERVGR